jgi:hypothetical protein
MSHSQFAAFNGRSCMSLITYRRDGSPVATVVWFVVENKTLYVRTFAGMGKMKRLRRELRVQIAPCGPDERLAGAYCDGTARIVTGDEAERAYKLLNRKYAIRAYDGVRGAIPKEIVILAIQLQEENNAAV